MGAREKRGDKSGGPHTASGRLHLGWPILSPSPAGGVGCVCLPRHRASCLCPVPGVPLMPWPTGRPSLFLLREGRSGATTAQCPPLGEGQRSAVSSASRPTAPSLRVSEQKRELPVRTGPGMPAYEDCVGTLSKTAEGASAARQRLATRIVGNARPPPRRRGRSSGGATAGRDLRFASLGLLFPFPGSFGSFCAHPRLIQSLAHANPSSPTNGRALRPANSQ